MGQLSSTKNWAWLSVQLVLLAVVFLAGWYWPGSWGSSWVNRSAGIALILVSAIIALACALQLKSNLSAFPDPRTRRLATGGIYRWERHPMYAGLLLLALGWVVWTGSLPALAAMVPLAWFLRRKAALEEKLLGKIYPEHARYAARTGCLLLGKSSNSQ